MWVVANLLVINVMVDNIFLPVPLAAFRAALKSTSSTFCLYSGDHRKPSVHRHSSVHSHSSLNHMASNISALSIPYVTSCSLQRLLGILRSLYNNSATLGVLLVVSRACTMATVRVKRRVGP